MWSSSVFLEIRYNYSKIIPLRNEKLTDINDMFFLQFFIIDGSCVVGTKK